MAVTNEILQLPEMPSGWIHNAELMEVPQGALLLLEKYGKISKDEILMHIDQVRERALKIYPYPCIGHYRFLDIQIAKSRAYEEILDRLSKGQKLIDIGCCIGQDLRQLVADGADSINLYGIDLHSEFFEIGYELFKDKNTLTTTFIPADLFAPDSILSRLEEEIDIIWTSSFLHLFSWSQQLEALRHMLNLLKSSGSLIIGRFMGHSTPGEYQFTFEQKEACMYRHNDQTFKKLFQEACDALGEVWEVEAEAPAWEETLELKREDRSVSTWALEVKFVARKIR